VEGDPFSLLTAAKKKKEEQQKKKDERIRLLEEKFLEKIPEVWTHER
jgi:hypothetical protein